VVRANIRGVARRFVSAEKRDSCLDECARFGARNNQFPAELANAFAHAADTHP